MRTVVIAIVLVLVSSAGAYAEVMDKEPSAAQNWLTAAAGGLLAIAAWRWRLWAGLTVTTLVMWELIGVYLELQDPFVGPAMRLEAGEQYVTQYYAAVAVAVVLNATGVYLRIRRSRFTDPAGA